MSRTFPAQNRTLVEHGEYLVRRRIGEHDNNSIQFLRPVAQVVYDESGVVQIHTFDHIVQHDYICA